MKFQTTAAAMKPLSTPRKIEKFKWEPGDSKHVIVLGYAEVDGVIVVPEVFDGVAANKFPPMLLSEVTHATNFGKYAGTRKRCLLGVEKLDEAGNVINDGTCPYCDAYYTHKKILNKASERLRIDVGLPVDFAQITPEMKETPVYKTYIKDFKAMAEKKPIQDYRVDPNDESNKRRSPRTKTNVLIVAELEADKNGPVLEDGQPKFELRLIQLSAGGLNTWKQAYGQIGGEVLGNTEMVVTYPDKADKGESAMDMDVSVAVAPYAATYPDIMKRISERYAKLELDLDIDIPAIIYAFQEETVAQAQKNLEATMQLHFNRLSPEDLASVIEELDDKVITASDSDLDDAISSIDDDKDVDEVHEETPVAAEAPVAATPVAATPVAVETSVSETPVTPQVTAAAEAVAKLKEGAVDDLSNISL